MSENIIMCENLVKIYKTRDLEVMALQGLELTVKRGELMAIVGNSGSGKSTFLNMAGGLDRPSAGKLFVNDKDLFAMKEGEYVAIVGPSGCGNAMCPQRKQFFRQPLILLRFLPINGCHR